ncbi:putative catabolite gene activator family protein (plasmid) [Pseudomonas aeruginosa]|jgi:CRP-like cAMP-binding protein
MSDGRRYQNSMIKNPTLAVYETPQPSWFDTSPQKGPWSTWLIHGVHMGATVELPAKTMIDTNRGDFYVVLKGSVVSYGASPETPNRRVFVDVLRPGDIIWPMRQKQVCFVFETRAKTYLLKVPKSKYSDYIVANPHSETVLMAGELDLMTKHSQAAHMQFSLDIDRIKRVIQILVEHPDARDTNRGIEVQASKEEIRTLAGVERRSGSRAFKTLEEEGTLSFNGYKSFFYRAPMMAHA